MNLMTVAFLAVLPGGRGGPGADDDTLVMRDGTTRSGKVQAAEAAGCVLAVGKKTETVAWTSVSSVQYGGAKEFDAARQQFAEGKRDEGIAALERLAADKKMRAPLRQEVLFELARVCEVKGDDDKALATWRELAKSYPNGRYLLGGGSWLVLALLARNDPGGALRAVDEMTSDARSANADAAQVAALDLLRGRALEGQKKFADAQTAYERVAVVKEMPADYVAAAQLGVARALQGAGKKDDAVKRYRELLEKRPPPLVSAGAWNGLGDAWWDGAVGKKDVDALEEGLLAYLRAVVVDAPAPAEPPEELERALAGSARCLQALADLENNKDRKAALVERAQKRQDDLKRLFPTSRLLKS